MAATTWNPSDLSGVTLSNGNLTVNASGGGYSGVRSIYQIPASAKVYFEYRCDARITSLGSYIGAAVAGTILAKDQSSQPNTFFVQTQGLILWGNGGSTGYTLGNINVGDVLCIAIDLSAANGYGYARLNAGGTWNYGNTPGPGAGAGVYIGYQLPNLCACFEGYAASGDQYTANFGASPFVGAVPPGFQPGLGTGLGLPAAVRRAIILA